MAPESAEHLAAVLDVPYAFRTVEIFGTHNSPGRFTVEARRADGKVAMSLVATVGAEEQG